MTGHNYMTMKKICCFIAAVALLSGCRTQRPAEQVGRDDAAAVPEVAGNRRTADFSDMHYYRPMSDGTCIVTVDHYLESTV